MDFHQPHLSAAFEGYYSKFTFPSGSHAILILCSVRHATKNPHMLHLSYIPHDNTPIYQLDHFVPDIQMTTHSPTSFTLTIPSIGTMTVHSPSHTTFDISIPAHSISLRATTTSRTPWSPSSAQSTPAGLFARLPLPLHWHVHARSSPCTLALTLPAPAPLLPADAGARPAHAHLEKNWGSSFPTWHIWMQAHDPDRGAGFVCAGGAILGLQAYLLGYVDEAAGLDVSFGPPWTVSLLGGWVAPGVRAEVDWEGRAVEGGGAGAGGGGDVFRAGGAVCGGASGKLVDGEL